MFQCKVCNKEFVKEWEYRYHEWTYHQELLCDICYAKLGNKYALSAHQKNIHGHGGTKPLSHASAQTPWDSGENEVEYVCGFKRPNESIACDRTFSHNAEATKRYNDHLHSHFTASYPMLESRADKWVFIICLSNLN